MSSQQPFNTVVPNIGEVSNQKTSKPKQILQNLQIVVFTGATHPFFI